MKRALLRFGLVLVVGVALWQGAVALRALFRKPVTHEAVVANGGRRAIRTLELRVGGRRVALGPLAGRDSARASFRVARDAAIELRWAWDDAPGDERTWRGEWIPRGPLSHRLSVTLRDDGGVLSRVTPVEQ